MDRSPAASRSHDAVVVGAGPNGLAAAIELARAGCSVVVREAAATAGGGLRSAELTLPGFVHDVCSAVHPLAVASPFFRSLDLATHGLAWIHSPAPLAHPFDDGTAVVLERGIGDTAATLDRRDAAAYRALMAPLVAAAGAILNDVLTLPRLPRHPLHTVRFGWRAIRSVRGLTSRFGGARAAALLAGLAAHAPMPLTFPGSAAFALVLGLSGHAVGWPIPRGGAGRVAAALASALGTLGGTIVCGTPVRRLDELEPARVIVLDLVPRGTLTVAGERLPPPYQRRLARYRHGPAAFKLDWALREPIPWSASECRRAATVHLGARFDEIAASERAVWDGHEAERPFVLVVQPTLFDDTRAPAGRHVAWAYCHVPNGSTRDATARIEAQIERFAPGFREVVLARSVRAPADLERDNANLVGGDINGGAVDLGQLFFRPVASLMPHRTPVAGLYLGSAATPPGPGVHGMCGWAAARAALRDRRLD